MNLFEDCKAASRVGREQVRGVRVARAGIEEEIIADLVVDGMGRGSPSARWLADAGMPEVEEHTVDAGAVYASTWFEPPRDIDDDGIE